MATKIVRPHSSRRIPTITSNERERQLGAARELYVERIICWSRCRTVEDCRRLRQYLTDFLALPADVLQECLGAKQ